MIVLHALLIYFDRPFISIAHQLSFYVSCPRPFSVTATLGAGLAVAGPATVGDTLTVTQTLTANADAAIAGAATVGGTFGATGAATFGGDVTITGDVTIIDGMLKRVSSGGRRLKSYEEQDAEIDQLRKELDAIKKHLNL